MKYSLKILSTALLILVFSIFNYSCNQQKEVKLTIATAANMQFAMRKLSTTFTEETNINCEIIISSSGKLTAQIKQGAPYDIFVSADMKYPNELFKTGFTLKKPEIYAYGKLVLWTLFDSIIPSIELLQHQNIQHIASANPKTAPYGNPTLEVLNFYKIFDSIKNKLVYGESIAQTNQFITTKSAEIGFTSKSVVLSPFIKGKGNWVDVDPNSYTPIKQGIVLLKNGTSDTHNAELFYNFIFSNKGKEILNKFGYSVIN